MFLNLRVLITALIITCSVSTVVSAGDAFSDFTRTWNGRRVVVRSPLYSVLYDEVGRMGRHYRGKLAGLTVAYVTRVSTTSSMDQAPMKTLPSPRRTS